jgi:hypothetical protein
MARAAHEDVAKGYVMTYLAAYVNRNIQGQGAPARIYLKEFFARSPGSLRLPMLQADVVHGQFGGVAGGIVVDSFETANGAEPPNELGGEVVRAGFSAVGGPGEFLLHWTIPTLTMPGDPTEDDRFQQWTTAEQLTWPAAGATGDPMYGTVLEVATVLGTPAKPLDVSSTSAVTFRAAQTMEFVSGSTTAVAHGNDADLSMTVQLVDAGGNVATVVTEGFSIITPPIVRLGGHAVDWRPWSKGHFVTVRLPLAVFEADGRSLDRSRLVELRLIFDRRATGKMALDDIGFEPLP